MTDMGLADELERWPGYNEQSWAERFAELDRKYLTACEQFQATLLRLALSERKEPGDGLVERLRAWKAQYRGDGDETTIPLAAEAADALESQAATIASLRKQVGEKK
jgi:hypothetical protein